MALISLIEIFYLIILILVVAYVFTGLIPIPRKKISLGLARFNKFDWEDFKFSAIVAAPGILFHELAHKFVAIIYGFNAEFIILKMGCAIAIILKAINSPLILIAPGFVKISGGATSISPLQTIFISFAGPAVNLILWLVCGYLLNHLTIRKRSIAIGLYLTKEINKMLFIFNMIPVPPLDGGQILWDGILKLF